MDGIAQAGPGEALRTDVQATGAHVEPAALPLGLANESGYWPDVYSSGSIPSLGSLSALPSMSMSFDSADGAGNAYGRYMEQREAHQAATSNGSEQILTAIPAGMREAHQPWTADGAQNPAAAMPAGMPTVRRTPVGLPVAASTLPANMPSCPPMADMLHVSQQPNGAMPLTRTASGTDASPFLTHCQVRASEYPTVATQLPVPTEEQIYTRMCDIRRLVEKQADRNAKSRQLRGGTQAATKQLEMQLDLVMRDYTTRLNQYLRGFSKAVAKQQLLLQERTMILGKEPDAQRCHARTAVTENSVKAKLSTLTQECLNTIDSALQGFRRDSMQLLEKYKEQQKKKEKLPDAAVKTLMLWVQNHFANPYPTRAEKLALMESTGLEMKQINQWFINTRVRIWRPAIQMVMDDQALIQ